ncbi:MAG: hypothetical protein ACLUD2_12595 [Clostridium sp.]
MEAVVREGQNWKYQAADGSFAKGWIHTASGWILFRSGYRSYENRKSCYRWKTILFLTSNPMALREECIPDGSKMRQVTGISEYKCRCNRGCYGIPDGSGLMADVIILSRNPVNALEKCLRTERRLTAIR